MPGSAVIFKARNSLSLFGNCYLQILKISYERFKISINNYISPKTKKIIKLATFHPVDWIENSTPIIKSYNSLLGQGWIDPVTNTIHCICLHPI